MKGFLNWMRYFEMSYMRDYYFFFCFIVLGFSSIVGSEKLLGRLLLMWCLSTALFLIFFVAIKSPWYMLPLMVPLYVAPFLLPAAFKISPAGILYNLFHHPVARFVVWIVIIGLCGSQLIFNLIKVIGYTQ